MGKDASGEFLSAVIRARKQKYSLRIRGGGSKDFLGKIRDDKILDTTVHQGIITHDPSELVVTVRAGTPLAELNAALAEHGQMLGFEPPAFDSRASVGGAVASGLSGPRRPYAGAVRDFVLGLSCVTGKAKKLRFGGQVIKNVAGYDLSRLMTGAMGTLGILCDISFKVLPLPKAEITIIFGMEFIAAHKLLLAWARKPLPVSATAYHDGILRVRLSGAKAAIDRAHTIMGGDLDNSGAGYWEQLRDYRLPFFTPDGVPLWRISVPPATEWTPPGDFISDWGGALYWLKSDADPQVIFATAQSAGGYAVRFPLGGDGKKPYLSPLPATLMHLHQQLKTAFDPDKVLNPGRMFEEL